MADKTNESELLKRAITVFGRIHQTAKAIEEMDELSTELARWLQEDNRTDTDKICEECADVMFMAEQVAIMFGYAQVEEWKRRKLERLGKIINGGNKECKH